MTADSPIYRRKSDGIEVTCQPPNGTGHVLVTRVDTGRSYWSSEGGFARKYEKAQTEVPAPGDAHTLERITREIIPGRPRESVILRSEHGALEAWRQPGSALISGPPHIGGVEVHLHQRPEVGQYRFRESCSVLNGPCWSEGSSMAFEEIAEDFESDAYIESGLRDLAPHFGLTFGLAEGEEAR